MNLTELKTINENVHKRFVRWLSKSGNTVKKMSDLTGLTLPALYNLKNNKGQNVTLRTVILIAREIGVQPSTMIKDIK